jgi:diadenylate cyclase
MPFARPAPYGRILREAPIVGLPKAYAPGGRAFHMNWLTELLQRPPVTAWDVVDITIVSVVVYEVLKLIRGTHAVQMAMGIALLVGMFYISRGFQLETVNWLIRNVVGYVVFAAIVLMQADIRRALGLIGRARLFRLFRRFDRSATDDDTVEELVVAVRTLASKRIGAIIVIERSVGLRNYIESGIPLDARLTYDLLVSIFQETSPLHDGAVIVQGDRIASAACFLPLTVNPRLTRDLGSRHRAAIGVTEENDSVAMVVSEETGVISLVMDGGIERSVEPDVLRARLAALIPKRRFIERRETGYSLN